MKLEVGMYVRTKQGTFARILKIDKMLKYEKKDRLIVNEEDWFLVESDLVKASNNIIDLIEVGDYVNGYRVDYIENINANNNFILQRIFCEEYEKDLYSKSFKPSDIKSIVTKEQFESVKYSLEE